MAKEKKQKKRSIGKIIATCVLIVISAVVGGGLGYVAHLDSQIQRPDQTEFDKDKIATNEEVKSQEEYTSIAIFGIDARNHSLGEGNRSDSIIIATINNNTKEVKLTSIYRDTLVQIPDKGYDKITHAYMLGGPELALSTINQNFDLNITDYVTVNFAIAEDIIDMLGGVEIDVQPSEVKWINGYVTSLAKEGADTNVKLIAGSGRQTLTGSQAVAYSRIRYTSGGDYKRAKRQRTVIDAALSKASASDLTTLDTIIQSTAKDIYTNFSIMEILNLAKDVTAYRIGDSQGFPYHVKEARCYDTYAQAGRGTAVGIPTMLAEDLKTFHYVLYNEGAPSTVHAQSDSMMNEDNGSANAYNGYGGNATTSTTEEPAINSSESTTQQSTDSALHKSYEPSQTAQSISAELQARVQ